MSKGETEKYTIPLLGWLLILINAILLMAILLGSCK